MIVTEEHDGGLRVVYQPDHAAGSYRLAARWRRPVCFAAPVWRRFLHAVARHDDGWLEAERRPTLDGRGRPHGFKTVPTPEHLAIWRRSLDQLQDDDPYAALLVALHARWLYTHVAEVSDDHAGQVQAFLDELCSRTADWVDALGRDPEAGAAVRPDLLEAARRLLGLFDAMSLMLLGGIPVEGFGQPVRFADAAAVLSLAARPGGLAVEPWPFEEGAFELRIPSRRLERARFEGPGDLAAALAAARSEPLRFEIVPT